MIRPLRPLAVLTSLLTAGCLASPSGNGNAPIVGTWNYAGVQTSPITATLNGTLQINSQQNGNFSGTLSVTETPNGGQPVIRSGAVSGQSISSTGVTFYVTLDNGSDDVSRVHLGTIAGDSLNGFWAEPDGGSGAPSGSFRAHRVVTP
ncbi:MAG: hypothetical protein ACHQXA_02505 [Gemmatimonadales bacterium]